MTDNQNNDTHEQTDIPRTEPVVEKRKENMDTKLEESHVDELAQKEEAKADTEEKSEHTPAEASSEASESSSDSKQEDSPQKEKKEPYNPNADLEFPKEIRINPEAQEEQDKLFIKLKEEYKSIESQPSETESDFKRIRKNLVDLKEKAEALFLVALEEKNAFIQSIQDYFQSINDRMDKIREEKNAEQEKLYEAHAAEIDAEIEKAKAEENFSQARKILIDLQAKLKDLDLSRERKQEIFGKIHEVFQTINQKQDEWNEKFEAESTENYIKYKPIVTERVEAAMANENYSEARKSLIDTQGLLKEVRMKRKQLDELFKEIRRGFKAVNDKQDAENAEFNKQSQETYEKLKPVVQEAIDYAVDPANYSTARRKLIDTQNEIKKHKMKMAHKNDLFGAIRAVFTKLNEHSDLQNVVDSESLENYERLKTKVNEAALNVRYSNYLNEIRNGLIDVREEVSLSKLSADHRNELLKSIRDAFSEYDKKKEKYFGNRRKKEKKDAGNAITKVNKEISDLEERISSINKDIELENAKIEHLAGDDEKKIIEEKIASLKENLESASKQLDEKKSEKEKLSEQD